MIKSLNSEEEKIEKILKLEKWQAYTSGKIEGALDVLFQLDIDKAERVSILQRVIGLSSMTATEFVEQREKYGKEGSR